MAFAGRLAGFYAINCRAYYIFKVWKSLCVLRREIFFCVKCLVYGKKCNTFVVLNVVNFSNYIILMKVY